MRSLQMCIADIANSKSIAIFCHTSPDADTLASAVALKKLIKQNMPENFEPKQIDIFVDADEINEINRAMIKGIEINVQNCDKYELGISVDCASSNRMGKYEQLYFDCENTINIDHHATNTYFAENNLVLKTSSTCEGLYILAKSRNYKISDEVCNLIYSGIITDTNNLTQGVITINTHKIITDLVARKINIDALNDHFFKNNTKSKAYLLQKALSSLRFLSGDRIAFMKITKQDMNDAEATFDDTIGIVNHGIDLKGVEIAILAIKKEDNSYYVSLRGKNNVNVGVIASTFGGGGHDQVAAFQYNGLLTDLMPQLTKVCKEELSKHPVEDIGENLFFGDETDSTNSSSDSMEENVEENRKI